VDDALNLARSFVGGVVAVKWTQFGPLNFYEVVGAQGGVLTLATPWTPGRVAVARQTHVSDPYLIRFAEIPPARRVY